MRLEGLAAEAWKQADADYTAEGTAMGALEAAAALIATKNGKLEEKECPAYNPEKAVAEQESTESDCAALYGDLKTAHKTFKDKSEETVDDVPGYYGKIYNKFIKL